MLRFPQIRQHKFLFLCALLTVLLLAWYYLSSEKESLGDWSNWRQNVASSKPSNKPATQTLVIARMKEENTTWVDELVRDLPRLTSAIYTVDDPNAALTVPMNKGHEAMVYLTYIIDHYFQLSDVTIFMHSHRITWHNNDFLNSDSALTIQRLKPEHVIRNEYMNLRCHQDPGCPDHIHPTADADADADNMANIPEAAIMGVSWQQLFPGEPVPEVLSQPCCGQFAVSSERIRRIPLEDYVAYRDWLLQTELEDSLSGRVWEYVWQWLFTGQSEYCPEEVRCYCEAYGVCFDADDYDEYFRARDRAKELMKDIEKLNESEGEASDGKARIFSMQKEIQGLHQRMKEIKATAG